MDELPRNKNIIRSDETAFYSARQVIENYADTSMACLGDEFRSLLLSAMSTLMHPIDSHHELIYGLFTSANATSTVVDDVTNRSKYTEDNVSRGGSIYRYGSSSSMIMELDLLPDQTVTELRAIVERMVVAGYTRECVQVYTSVRKPELESGFQTLGIESLSIGDIDRLEWESLERKIRRWIKAAKVCVRILFMNEKRLCQQIFEGLGVEAYQARIPMDNNNVDYTAEADDVNNVCFTEIVKPFAIQMFSFVEAISISQRSPEKLFKILDLYDTMLDLLPDIQAVFDSKPLESIKIQVSEIVSCLAEATRGVFSEFENKVLNEPSTVPVPGGTVHPLTRYVMNYVNLISHYKQTMTELIMSKPLWHSGDPMTPDIDLDDLEGKSPLCVHLTWIIVILQFNLECKSKHYKDASLSHLFLMNNVHYTVMKIKGSPELMEMIGDDYLKKLTGRYRQAATSYQRSTWVKVLYCLRDEGLHASGGFTYGISKRALKDRFKTFNAMFDEVHRVQATWIVPDNQLREELRLEISEWLIPAYRSFLGRFRGYIERGKHPEAYIKYSVDDLERYTLSFFEDCEGSQHSKRGS